MSLSTDQLLTVKEASRILKLTPLTLYEYIRRGTLQAVKLGRYYRIARVDLLKFIERHKTPTII